VVTVVVLMGGLALPALVAGPVGAARNPKAIAVLRQAVAASVASQSADATLGLSISAPGQGSDSVMTFSGSETFTTPPEGVFTATLPSASGQGTQTISEILTANAVYLQVNGTWYSTTAQQALGNLGISGSITASNPTQSLALLVQAGNQVAKVGPATVDGQATTEYRVLIDLDRSWAHHPNGLTMSPAALRDYEQLIGSSTVPGKVWIDPEGRLRQFVLDMPLSSSALDKMGLKGAPKGIEEVLTMGLSNYGVTVSAIPPPASEVKPLPATGNGAGSAL
jgi:hypothetical protein